MAIPGRSPVRHIMDPPGVAFLTTEGTVGAGEVIPGWDEGLLDMCLSETRTLTIPSRKAFGMFALAKRNHIPRLTYF